MGTLITHQRGENYRLLEEAHTTLFREAQSLFPDHWETGKAWEIGADVVDHVRRVTGHFYDHHYAREKAAVVVLDAIRLWEHTWATGLGADHDDDLDAIVAVLRDAFEHAQEAARELAQ